jgi:hypothetical protein
MFPIELPCGTYRNPESRGSGNAIGRRHPGADNSSFGFPVFLTPEEHVYFSAGGQWRCRVRSEPSLALCKCGSPAASFRKAVQNEDIFPIATAFCVSAVRYITAGG